ncbi:MAG: hypothetical protein A3D53_00600 [Candidatus Magasanikbacteria bacterium RIFCSPHIGHO2_02_FULL_45_10]|uniref:Uncharacterized protein n=1 Tax=Candidatus Magasanikbacteria bacterium RIFCSPHIGHO2_02_FULL_45_10 TaxID=1798679 RepID=A0A1F6MB98_9BACT|nr:MAG: hypothetical protein A3D53_00600 [Candidatus Magasanikbacteria bacterium RIFCSPHIGHO2_02_FULL_45_10]
MSGARDERGFTILEVTVGVAIFLIFAVGVFSALTTVFKMVYQSRLRILETAVATEQLEVIRNLPFASVGVVGGVPAGVLVANKTIVRGGMVFIVTTTIRNIDDPFDGTVTSTPVDDAPADFKYAEVEVQCSQCNQVKPFVMSTLVAPKDVETATNNGSLFIQVFDAVGLPISGATIQVDNTSTVPTIAINDLTGEDGWLRIIDTVTGTLAYHIRVSKNGYSSDYTVTSSPSNPSPTKLPASVVSQTITNAFFSIDELGAINLMTMSPVCEEIGTAPVLLRGQKQIGSLPVVYKYDRRLTTNSDGSLAIAGIEWDTYSIQATGTAYDLVGTIPLSPFNLLPGASQDVSVILNPHSARSLLVKVKDSGTGLPLSGATVRLSSASYDQSLLTGLGYVQQTDWSGGAGQVSFLNNQQYFSDDSRIDTTGEPGEIKLKLAGEVYLLDGYLESSTFDLGTNVNFSNLLVNPTSQPTSTGSSAVRLQLATSNSSTPTEWEFLGPDGTADSYYSAINTVINSINNGNRYARYRVFLETADSAATPNVSDVSITYTTSCVAPGQSFFSGLSAGDYDVDISRNGYTTNSGQITINGNMETQVNLSSL